MKISRTPSGRKGERVGLGEYPLELQASILAQLDDAVIVSDPTGRISYWNNGAETIFGYRRSDVIGKSVSHIYPSDQTSYLQKHLDAVRAEKMRSMEVEGLRRDGNRVWLHVRTMVLKNKSGIVSGLVGLARDITRERREAEAIRQSEQLYRAVGESINFGVWACDTKGRLTHMSDSFMKMLGLTSAQNLGDGWLNALHPDEREGIMQDWRICLKAGLPWKRRYRIRGADGHYRFVMTHGAPVRNDEGRILCWAGLNLDASAFEEREKFS